MSEAPMRSWSIWEIAELNATKIRPRQTCNQLRCEAGFGGEACEGYSGYIGAGFLAQIQGKES